MSKSNWPFGTDLSHPNFTGITKRECGGYAPNSDRPPLGWPIAIALGVAVSLLFFFMPNIVFWIIK